MYSHLLKHKIKYYDPDEKQQLCIGGVKDNISRLHLGIFFYHCIVSINKSPNLKNSIYRSSIQGGSPQVQNCFLLSEMAVLFHMLKEQWWIIFFIHP